MKKQFNLTTKYIILICVLLLAVNVLFGAIAMNQSAEKMKEQIRKYMGSVANTAAEVIDGNKLKAITEEDTEKRTDAYREIADELDKVLRAQHDDNIKYIYTVKWDQEQKDFVFLLDPDKIDPGKFGEIVEARSPMMEEAWNKAEGRVDTKKYEDRWGEFYSAWSPVWASDENGDKEMVAIVGVDFGADVYVSELVKLGILIGLVSLLSLGVGVAVVTLLTFQLRQRFRTLNTEISTLSTDVETLSAEIRVRPGERDPEPREESEASDSLTTISEKIRVMQKRLKDYMDYAHEQAFTDSMTGVSNKTAYLARVKELNQEINTGVASFAIVVFDINGLKSTNDNYGHECGDRIIIDAAKIICRVFPKEQVYRIGGDEFIAVTPTATEEVLEGKFRQLREATEKFNREEKKYAMTLSFSWGGAIYRPGQDSDVKSMFKRADEAMYRNKNKYYQDVATLDERP